MYCKPEHCKHCVKLIQKDLKLRYVISKNLDTLNEYAQNINKAIQSTLIKLMFSDICFISVFLYEFLWNVNFLQEVRIFINNKTEDKYKFI